MKRILIGCPHGGAVFGVPSTAGKRSPDGRLVEGVYCREVAFQVTRELRLSGIETEVIFAGNEHCVKVKLGSKYVAKWRYLNWLYVRQEFSYIEIHTNAAGNDGWYDASGPRVFVAKNAGRESRALADRINWKLTGADDMLLPLIERNLNVLSRTKFPSVLVELFFHTNKADVDFALSPAGVWTYKRALVDGIRGYLGEVS